MKSIKVVLILLAVILPSYYIYFAYGQNKEHGFPLDDPWIHLTFAKNLAEFGEYSFYKDEIITAGSTSPLYTFLLSAGFIVTKNEMILSYAAGILFFALAAFFFFKLSENIFSDAVVVIGCSLLFVIDRWLNFISGSGMETTMFIFVLIACFYFYLRRDALPFAISAGLLIWSRPDGAVFLAAVVIDYLWAAYIKRRYTKKEGKPGIEFTKAERIRILIIIAVFISIYFLMNLIISGSILPNTYTAKTTYYTPEFRSRADFLKYEVRDYFTSSSYSLLFIPFFIGAGVLIFDIARKKYNWSLAPVLFILFLIFVYWYKLPYAARFGRYLMPVIPFYILVFGNGIVQTVKFSGKFFKNLKISRVIIIIFLTSAVVYSFADYNSNKNNYAEQCRYISIRQVAAAKWVRENTPAGSIVATHDVGAIAYYSERKIIDVVGLINPELAPRLLEKNYNVTMSEELKKQNVTYLAFLREWYRVVNQPPLFSGGENNYEIMEVYKFDREKTHILRSDANSLNMYALEFIARRQFQQAANILKQSVSVDPNSSLTYYYLAYVMSVLGDNKSAEKFLGRSLELYPGYKEAKVMLDSLKGVRAR